MAEQYTSVKLILDKIMRHPLLQDISLETVVDYTIDFMRIVGVPSIFDNKVVILEIKDYRALLPCDLYQIEQIKLDSNGNTFRYSTDSFHLSKCKISTDLTYKIQGNIIYTSIKEGLIEISYMAIAVDKDGYPLLPDNSSFTRALESYIKKQWFTILFDLNKISPNSYQNALRDYAWAVGDCQSEFNRLTIDKMESLCNSWRTLLSRDNEHNTSFRNNGTKERLKI